MLSEREAVDDAILRNSENAFHPVDADTRGYS
jgi:hypothetical protein